MCLAIPGRLRSIGTDPDGMRSAVVEYPGTTRTASLVFLPDAREGDYVLVQAGFAMRLVTAEQAEETYRALASAPAERTAGVGPARTTENQGT
jgi:hydrogenase expression/formation protein HypC